MLSTEIASLNIGANRTKIDNRGLLYQGSPNVCRGESPEMMKEGTRTVVDEISKRDRELSARRGYNPQS